MIGEAESCPDDPDSDAESFFNFIEQNDIKEAVKQLRKLKLLTKMDVERLADLLDDDPWIHNFENYKLVIKHRSAGKPSLPKVNLKAASQTRGRLMEREFQKSKTLKETLWTAAQKTGVKRSTLMKDRSQLLKLRRAKSPLKKKD